MRATAASREQCCFTNAHAAVLIWMGTRDAGRLAPPALEGAGLGAPAGGLPATSGRAIHDFRVVDADSEDAPILRARVTDVLRGEEVLTDSAGTATKALMRRGSGDQFTAWIAVHTLGDAVFQIEAWGDPISTWIHRAQIKIPAQIDVDLELREGELLYATALKGLPRGKVREPLKAAITAVKDSTRPARARLAAATAPDVVELLTSYPLREHVTSTQSFPITVERERALYGSWYEFFPRSEGASLRPRRSGTFTTAAARLDAVAEMGFDVVYLPPIHPIGRSFRKGPNNTLNAGPQDPLNFLHLFAQVNLDAQGLARRVHVTLELLHNRAKLRGPRNRVLRGTCL